MNVDWQQVMLSETRNRSREVKRVLAACLELS